MAIILMLRHIGPGPHPSGSPQSVHGKGGSAVHEDAAVYPAKVGKKAAVRPSKPENLQSMAEKRVTDQIVQEGLALKADIAGLSPVASFDVLHALEQVSDVCHVRPLRAIRALTGQQMDWAVADSACNEATGSTTIRLNKEKLKNPDTNFTFSVTKWQNEQKMRTAALARYEEQAEEEGYSGPKPQEVRIMELENADCGRFSRWGVAYKEKGIQTVVFHEYGHYLLNLAESAVVSEKKIAIAKFGDSGGMVDKCRDLRMNMRVDKSLFGVSKYAAADPEEWFAECFSMYMADIERDKLPDYTVKFIKKVITKARENNLSTGVAG